MNIEKIMNRNIISASVDSSLYEIASLMKENNIGFLPIHRDKKIIGVITDRDVVTKMLVNKDFKNISNYLSLSIITADRKAPLQEVLYSMQKHKIKRILITEQNKVIGILSLSDLIKQRIDTNSLLETIQSIFETETFLREGTTEIDTFYL